jgi:hypothetical protein
MSAPGFHRLGEPAPEVDPRIAAFLGAEQAGQEAGEMRFQARALQAQTMALIYVGDQIKQLREDLSYALPTAGRGMNG